MSGNISAEKFASGYRIPELIESAAKVSEARYNKDEAHAKENIDGYEYYENRLYIDEKPYGVYIRVRNTPMGDKYYGHTIGRVVEEINIEPLARTYDETSLHPVYASDSISDNNISHPDTTVKNKEQYEYLINFKEIKGNNPNHTIKNNLRPAGYQPFDNKISHSKTDVNNNSMLNSIKDAEIESKSKHQLY